MNITKTEKTSIGTQGEQAGQDLIKIGMDVHAHFVVVCRQVDGSVPQRPQKIKAGEILKWIERQKKLAAKVVSCYEAGPTGFWLHRKLMALGVENYVVAPSRLDSRGKGVNTDKTDAIELLNRLDRYLAGNRKAFSVVTVPSAEQEQRRLPGRQREQLRRHRLSYAAQGRTLLLLHGFRTSNQWWKPRRWEALREELPSWLVQALEIFHKLIEQLHKEINQLGEQLEAAAPKQLPKGMGPLTYELLQREIGDWKRFKKSKQAGSYSGLTGGVASSGQQQADLGITKSGNGRVRALVVELAWRMTVYQPDYWLLKKWKHVLLNPRAHARQRKRALVAFARQLFVDIWKWQTGQATPRSLGWSMTAAS